MIKLLKRLNSYLAENKENLESWSALMQILVIPPVVVAGVAGYFQIENYLEKADVYLKFRFGTHISWTIVNSNSTNAEQVHQCFIFFDIDSANPLETLNIPCRTESLDIRKDTPIGPYALLGDLEINNHRYYGQTSIFCKNCEGRREYWVYHKYGTSEGWIFEVSEKDREKMNPYALVTNPNKYFKENFSEYKKIDLREYINP